MWHPVVFQSVQCPAPHHHSGDGCISTYQLNLIPFGTWVENRFVIKINSIQFSSVQFSRSVVSESLRPHESQHARPPCPSPTPGVHSDSRPSSRSCHPAISSSVVAFSCPQSLPASESFPMSQLFDQVTQV